MFICSFKLNKTRLLSGIAALCLALTLVFLILPEPNADVSTLGAISAKNQQEMVDYLAQIGYTVAPQAILIEQITIPENFDDTYEEYNEMQKKAGFDLKDYAGQSAHKYTFKVLDYEDAESEVVANVLVAGDKIIGGDISSTALGGFCNSLKKEETDKSNNDQEKSPE